MIGTPLDAPCLSFSPRWIVRQDKYYGRTYAMFNIDTGEMFDLEPLAFALCRLVQLNRCGAPDVLRFFKDRGVDERQEQEIKHAIHFLYEKGALISADLSSYESICEKDEIVEPSRVGSAPVATTPYDVEIHLTNSCNLRCKHCAYDAGRKLSGQLNGHAWLDIADQLEQMSVFRVILSGGEPLLHPDAARILKHLSEKNLRIEIFTNGTLINDMIANTIAAPNISTSVSVDGAKRETHDSIRGQGSYDKTIAAVHRLCQSKATFHISTTLHANNLDEMPRLIEWADASNASSINFIVLDTMGRAKENPDLNLDDDQIEKTKRDIESVRGSFDDKIRIGFVNPSELVYADIGSVSNDQIIYCTAGTMRMAIRSDGIVFPCVYGFFGNDRFSMGAVKSSSLQEIWSSERWEAFRGGTTLAEIEGCADCTLAPKCVIKVCRLRPYYDTGNFLGQPSGCRNRHRCR
jgi:MoaA/NifB/PqqE/SkfB family radical SAM enzyme